MRIESNPTIGILSKAENDQNRWVSFLNIFLFQRSRNSIGNMASASDSSDMSDYDDMLNDDELSQVEEVETSRKDKDKGIPFLRFIR